MRLQQVRKRAAPLFQRNQIVGGGNYVARRREDGLMPVKQARRALGCLAGKTKKEEFPGLMQYMLPGNSFPQICVVTGNNYVENMDTVVIKTAHYLSYESPLDFRNRNIY